MIEWPTIIPATFTAAAIVALVFCREIIAAWDRKA